MTKPFPKMATCLSRALIGMLMVVCSVQSIGPALAQGSDPDPDLAVMALNPLDFEAANFPG